MKFLVDAQLPRRLARWLQERGHDVTHAFDLTQQNRTPDPALLTLANQDQRILVTKDTDFEVAHQLGQGPPKLLLITTGNIHNNELLDLFSRHEQALLGALKEHSFIELNRTQLIVHK